MPQPYMIVGQDGNPYLVVNNDQVGAMPSLSFANRPALPAVQQFKPNLSLPQVNLQSGNPLPQIVSPGPSMFPTIPSAQGNQLGSLPMGGPRFVFEAGDPIVQSANTRPQRNFIGRRVIAIVGLVTDVAGAALQPEAYLSNFLVGAQYQLGSGDPINLGSMATNATGAAFTINSVEPGMDYTFGVSWLGRTLAGADRVTVSFTIYGDTTR